MGRVEAPVWIVLLPELHRRLYLTAKAGGPLHNGFRLVSSTNSLLETFLIKHVRYRKSNLVNSDQILMKFNSFLDLLFLEDIIDKNSLYFPLCSDSLCCLAAVSKYIFPLKGGLFLQINERNCAFWQLTLLTMWSVRIFEFYSFHFSNLHKHWTEHSNHGLYWTTEEGAKSYLTVTVLNLESSSLSNNQSHVLVFLIS